MHILFLNQYYPPDVAPTGVMLEAVVECLAKDGHHVTVFCASGGYAESMSSHSQVRDATEESLIRIVRIGSPQLGRVSFIYKLLDYSYYYVMVMVKCFVLSPKPDRIIALTTPPYLSILARFFSKIRGGDHAHWVMDLYPDVMCSHGMLSKRSHLYRFLQKLTRWGFSGKRCAAVLTLGPDMYERVNEYLCDTTRANLKWVPLWGGDNFHIDSDDLLATQELRMKRGWGHEDFIVMYSGNMGLGHRFEEILNTTKSFENENVRFVFFGFGKRRVEVEKFVREHPTCKIELHDYVAMEILTEHLMSANLHFVSLDPKWTGTMVPSKLQGIFEVGRPVVFLGSGDSSIAEWIKASGGGWVVIPENPDGVRKAIGEARNPTLWRKRANAAKIYAESNFNKTNNVRRIVNFLVSNSSESSAYQSQR